MSKQHKTSAIRFPYFFLLLNLLVMIGIYLVLSHTMERSLSSAIIQATQASNSDITKIFVNEVYPELKADIGLSSASAKAKAALSDQELERVDLRVRAFMLGTDVLKAKIYNINGVTIYSSEAAQIGVDKKADASFADAVRGIPASEVTHRGQFSSLYGDVFDRDLVSSYIPIRSKSDEIIGVAELYTDRSAEVEHSNELIVGLKSKLIPALVTILLLVASVIWRFTSYVTQLKIDALEQD